MSTTDEGQQDLFDDQPAAEVKSEAEIVAEKPAADAQADAEGEKPKEEDQTGEESEASGTPTEEQEGTEGQDANASGKMIPEHRFKAALNDVNSKLEAANKKIAELTATPVPDKATDPEGHAFHVRMETSKQVVREMHPDYDTVIVKFKEMAEANPALNQAVYDHPIPAKFAYDLVKKQLELEELQSVKGSDEWKEFQEFKKNKAKQPEVKVEEKVGKQVADSLGKVPNLNRQTNVTKGNAAVQTDDELFAGAL